eukprot:1764922-Prorocentrum_lima.AAC.1
MVPGRDQLECAQQSKSVSKWNLDAAPFSSFLRAGLCWALTCGEQRRRFYLLILSFLDVIFDEVPLCRCAW